MMKRACGAMQADEIHGKRGSRAPRFDDAQHTDGRPHGVGDEAHGVFQAVAFGLVALRDRGGDTPDDGETLV